MLLPVLVVNDFNDLVLLFVAVSVPDCCLGNETSRLSIMRRLGGLFVLSCSGELKFREKKWFGDFGSERVVVIGNSR